MLGLVALPLELEGGAEKRRLQLAQRLGLHKQRPAGRLEGIEAPGACGPLAGSVPR